jgi:hypothetical protein
MQASWSVAPYRELEGAAVRKRDELIDDTRQHLTCDVAGASTVLFAGSTYVVPLGVQPNARPSSHSSSQVCSGHENRLRPPGAAASRNISTIAVIARGQV